MSRETKPQIYIGGIDAPSMPQTLQGGAGGVANNSALVRSTWELVRNGNVMGE
jgi:thiamine monophosphate synthase